MRCSVIGIFFLDYVLVYDEELKNDSSGNSKSDDKELDRNEKWRNRFLHEIKEAGLEIEEVLT